MQSIQTPLGMGGFATTLLTLSLSMMDFRGVSNQTVFIGNLCFVACIGLLISAQWEMVRGQTFAYTVFSAFGMYASWSKYYATLELFGFTDSRRVVLYDFEYSNKIQKHFSMVALGLFLCLCLVSRNPMVAKRPSTTMRLGFFF